jgi:hypothetical protein
LVDRIIRHTRPLRELHVGCVHEGVVFMKVSFILIAKKILNLLEDDKAWLYMTSNTHGKCYI